MTIAEQIHWTRVEIRTHEGSINSCECALSNLETGVFNLHFQSVVSDKSSTVIIYADEARACIAAQLEAHKIRLARAGQKLQDLINLNQS